MLIRHFAALQPVCPACRLRGSDAALTLSLIEAESGGDVEAGLLLCESCGEEYPILDGVPVIVPDLARYIQANLFYLLARGELPAGVAGVLGDLGGPGSALDAVRQHISSYAWDHWGDQDAADPCGAGRGEAAAGGAAPGAIVRAVDAGLELLGDAALPDGPILDIGCGTGRSVAELARRTGRMVLGCDLSVPLARFGRAALMRRSISYDRRRIGLAYDRRRFPVGLSWPEGSVDVWLCDLLALPFRAGSFAMVSGFNVVDCLADPRAGIAAVGQALKEDGGAILCTPFDWSGGVTEPAAWLGGRSRGERAGAAEPVLAQVAAASLQEIRTAEIAWHVRLHDRATVCYRTHLIAARRRADSAAATSPSRPSAAPP